MKRLATYTLLLVEDDPKAQEQLKLLLGEYFREIHQAYNGEEALHLYQQYRPDIVLADITMPIMSGLRMAQEIKAIDPHQPILFLTGHSDSEMLLAAANIPVDGYITKPIADVEHLFDGLIRIADKLQHSSEKIETRILQIKDEYQQKLKTLYYRSHYDHLTRMPNRYLFLEHLTKSLESAKQAHSTVTLFYIDLDHLKRINDTLGHQVGDHAIKNAISHVQEILDPRDIFARIGGDEFALIVETMDDPDSLKTLAGTILKAASAPFYHQGESLHLTCSIGISRYPQDTSDMRALIDRADQAMYRAKSVGKNTYRFWGD